MARDPDKETIEQLTALGYLSDGSGQRHDRPLLICDVDEVVVHLVDPFVQVLQEQGFYLKSHSFKLTGNVFCKTTDREATQEEVWGGLDQLFREQEVRQSIVDGVTDALNDLSADIDVLFLTNMPHAYRSVRQVHLANHGLEFPTITNTGSKVGAIKTIQHHRDAPVGFIDDTPKNLDQVRDELSNVHLFHFMANHDFRAMAGVIEGAKVSTGDWQEATQAIRETLVVG